ncbi:MAG: adenosylmethionine--8-amino-7-oxononanoate transaminase [Candidatus Melainabacteria bacterium]|jgi:adenosylmethionine---8-amino-7-oxononanoate aminotransferase|nr:adenosylmethionine--8-amino-7-oxononanoate transaminase [Candidatus Melainabacteria bacterium]
MAKELWQIDQEHIWHPYTQHAIADKPLLVKRAKDEFIIIENENGQEVKLIDGISSWWVNIHGHCNEYINSKIKEQLDKHEQVVFAGFTHEPAIRLIEKLLPLLPKRDLHSEKPRRLSKAFFSDNGSTAVEVAIKMAIQYWQNNGQAKRHRIIAFKDSYHGDTIGTMSIGGTPTFHQAFKKLMFPVNFVDSPSPKLVNPNQKLNLIERQMVKEEARELAEQKALEQITILMNHFPGEIAAIVIEPLVQAASGMKFHRPVFLQKLRRLADQAGIFIIADEVFTGFGRTGSDFACQQAAIVPDIIALSKGITGGYMPMGLTVCTEEIYSAFHSKSASKTFFHGHSYTGNSLSCAAALASLELYIKEDRLKDVNYINMVMQKELPELIQLDCVKDVRIMGAIGVIEFNTDTGYLSELGPKLTQAFLERQILLRPLGNVLYFMPPYTISIDSLNYCLQTIKELAQELAEESYNVVKQ